MLLLQSAALHFPWRHQSSPLPFFHTIWHFLFLASSQKLRWVTPCTLHELVSLNADRHTPFLNDYQNGKRALEDPPGGKAKLQWYYPPRCHLPAKLHRPAHQHSSWALLVGQLRSASRLSLHSAAIMPISRSLLASVGPEIYSVNQKHQCWLFTFENSIHYNLTLLSETGKSLQGCLCCVGLYSLFTDPTEIVWLYTFKQTPKLWILLQNSFS